MNTPSSRNRRLVIAVLGLGLLAALFWFFARSGEPAPHEVHIEVPRIEADTAYDLPPEPVPEVTPEVVEPVEPTVQGTGNAEALKIQQEKVRAEIRFALAKVYNTQKDFFAEFGRYSTDLRLTGWDYEAKSLNFKMGFLQPGRVGGDLENEEPQEMDTDLLLRESKEKAPDEWRSYSALAENISLQEFANLCLEGCSASDQGFEAMAISKIGPDGKTEVWLINEKNELRQVKD